MSENEIENPVSMSDVRKAIKSRGEEHRSQFEGDICDGKQPAVSDYIDAKTAPFISGFVESMHEIGIDTPEQCVAAVQANPQLGVSAQFAAANLSAITKDAAARYGDACDADFQRWLAGRHSTDTATSALRCG